MKYYKLLKKKNGIHVFLLSSPCLCRVVHRVFSSLKNYIQILYIDKSLLVIFLMWLLHYALVETQLSPFVDRHVYTIVSISAFNITFVSVSNSSFKHVTSFSSLQITSFCSILNQNKEENSSLCRYTLICLISTLSLL